MGEFDGTERKVPQKNLRPASILHQGVPIWSKLEAGFGSSCVPLDEKQHTIDFDP